MDIKELEIRVRRSFNNTICLIGVIPFLVFVYILTVRVSSLEALAGETGYVMLASMFLLLLGIAIGRKIIWMVIKRLVDFNREVLDLQKKLIEKNRLAVITETALSLSHEINNPLAVIVGAVESLNNDFKRVSVPDSVKDKFNMVRKNCERIKAATSKLASLKKPVLSEIKGGIRWIDASKSE